MSRKHHENAVPAEIEEQPKVKGLSIREIRYRRALLALKKDFCREKVLLSHQKLMHSSPFSKHYKPESGSSLGRAGAIAAKLFSGLNYVDYAVAGLSIFKTGRKIFGLFRR